MASSACGAPGGAASSTGRQCLPGAESGLLSNGTSAHWHACKSRRYRRCPKCQDLVGAELLAERQAQLLSAPQLHIVVIVPVVLLEIAQNAILEILRAIFGNFENGD